MSAASWLLDHLAQREKYSPIKVAVIGGGTMGRAIVRAVSATRGMRSALMVSRYPESQRDIPAAKVTTSLTDEDLTSVDVVVDASGRVEVGAKAALDCIGARKPFLSFSGETEALIGVHLTQEASKRETVYGFSDGDQPGVIGRLIDDLRLRGIDVRAAFNCKGFLDRSANPSTIASWTGAVAAGTRARMVTSFTDGTKINQEMTIVTNATGFLPRKQGMSGIRTTLARAAEDIVSTLGVTDGTPAFVDYTLGGDFAGGVFVLAIDRDPVSQDLMRYMKAGGPGPWRIFYRPYHLCAFEVPASIAEAIVFKRSTIVSRRLMAHTISIAKRDLRAGTELDGIGGFDLYGEIASSESCGRLLPIGLSEGAILLRDIARGEVVELADVDLPTSIARDLFERQSVQV